MEYFHSSKCCLWAYRILFICYSTSRHIRSRLQVTNNDDWCARHNPGGLYMAAAAAGTSKTDEPCDVLSQ